MQVSPITFRSSLDPTVNQYVDGFETRFATRKDRVVVYLSSFKGCDQACRMCHLTQTGQTDMTAATIDDFIYQAQISLEEAFTHYSKLGETPKYLHFNFMARGEPMLNKVIVDTWEALSEELIKVALNTGFTTQEIKFNISTIMAGIYEYDENKTIVGGMSSLPFKVNKPAIYYSLYSTDALFRKRWLPKAEAPHEMLRLLSSYKNKGGKVVFHNAFIKGHNDDLVDVNEMIKAIKFFGLIGEFNIIRFNSPDITKWEETDEEQLTAIQGFLESKGFSVQLVDRVGVDVYASCGMFYHPEAEEV